jgi:hypothetical protein
MSKRTGLLIVCLCTITFYVGLFLAIAIIVRAKPAVTNRPAVTRQEQQLIDTVRSGQEARLRVGQADVYILPYAKYPGLEESE